MKNINGGEIKDIVTVVNSAMKYWLYLVKHMTESKVLKGRWLELGYQCWLFCEGKKESGVRIIQKLYGYPTDMKIPEVLL